MARIRASGRAYPLISYDRGGLVPPSFFGFISLLEQRISVFAFDLSRCYALFAVFPAISQFLLVGRVYLCLYFIFPFSL